MFGSELLELTTRWCPYDLGGCAMYNYSSKFVWPRAYASGHLVFMPAEGSTDYSPSATGSEYLSIAPIIAKFLRAVVLLT